VLLGLVSPGVLTDGVTLFTSKTDDLLVVVLQTTVTTPILSDFSDDRLSSVLVNSAAEIFRLSLGSHSPGWCHPGQSAPPQ